MSYWGVPMSHYVWCFDEATIGVAALNAWYGQPKLFAALGAEFAELSAGAQSALAVQRETIGEEEAPTEGAVSSGDRSDDGEASLEQQPDDGVRTKRETDAFEYYRPIIERFSDTGRRTKVIAVGPSAVASRVLFDYGVSAIAGRTVVDPERVRFSVATGAPFGDALRSFIIRAR